MRPRSPWGRQTAVPPGQIPCSQRSQLLYKSADGGKTWRPTSLRRANPTGVPHGAGARSAASDHPVRGHRTHCPQEHGRRPQLAIDHRWPTSQARRHLAGGRPTTVGNRLRRRLERRAASSRRRTGDVPGAEPFRDSLSRRSQSTPHVRRRSTPEWNDPNIGSSGAPIAAEPGPSRADSPRTLAVPKCPPRDGRHP